jgi:AraC-like DNA-binding protein
MCDLGVSPENFNPRVLYVFKKHFDTKSKLNYHSHDFTSIIYVLSGTCTYNIEGLFYHVGKGDIILCNPEVRHGKILEESEALTELHIGFNNLYIRDLPKNCIVKNDSCPVINLPQLEYDLYKCFDEMLQEQEKNEPGWELMLKAQFMRLLILILKGTRSEKRNEIQENLNLESYERQQVVSTIVSFLNENYMKEVSLGRISKNMYLSPVYISKIFKEETGDSPINYLIRIRLAKARELLHEGNLPVKAVAKNVGYNDAYYFSKLYKKYYGHPPSRYKAG